MKPYFDQCHRCGPWVCGQVCWNRERGMCVGSAHINYRGQGTAICPNCHAETGGGTFCASCGTALAAAPPAAVKFCTNCGTVLGAGRFCGECGTPAGG
jgi:ribosomal protein L32